MLTPNIKHVLAIAVVKGNFTSKRLFYVILPVQIATHVFSRAVGEQCKVEIIQLNGRYIVINTLSWTDQIIASMNCPQKLGLLKRCGRWLTNAAAAFHNDNASTLSDSMSSTHVPIALLTTPGPVIICILPPTSLFLKQSFEIRINWRFCHYLL